MTVNTTVCGKLWTHFMIGTGPPRNSMEKYLSIIYVHVSRCLIYPFSGPLFGSSGYRNQLLQSSPY